MGNPFKNLPDEELIFIWDFFAEFFERKLKGTKKSPGGIQICFPLSFAAVDFKKALAIHAKSLGIVKTLMDIAEQAALSELSNISAKLGRKPSLAELDLLFLCGRHNVDINAIINRTGTIPACLKELNGPPNYYQAFIGRNFTADDVKILRACGKCRLDIRRLIYKAGAFGGKYADAKRLITFTKPKKHKERK
jgi:hypothetical protein